MQDEKAIENIDASGHDACANNEGAEEPKPEEPRTASVLSESNGVSITGVEKETAAAFSESAECKFSWAAAVYMSRVLVIVSLLVVLVGVSFCIGKFK